jgi:hypothetical protein
MHPHYLSTGGDRQRTAAERHMEYLDGLWWGRTLFGDIGQLISVFHISGPIDAPDWLPAGAMNSTEWTNGRGPIPAQTTVTREES